MSETNHIAKLHWYLALSTRKENCRVGVHLVQVMLLGALIRELEPASVIGSCLGHVQVGSEISDGYIHKRL